MTIIQAVRKSILSMFGTQPPDHIRRRDAFRQRWLDEQRNQLQAKPADAMSTGCMQCNHEGSCIGCSEFAMAIGATPTQSEIASRRLLDVAMADINDGGAGDPAQFSSSHEA